MSVMRALLWQEWRDQRRVMLVITILAMISCFAVQRFEPTQYDAEWVTTIVLPGLAALFLGIAGTDLLICPEADGRGHLHAGLPVTSLRVWSAKVLYLLLSGVAFVCVLALLNSFLVTSPVASPNFGGPGTSFHIATQELGLWITLAVLLFASAVLFFSSLLQRRTVAIWCAGLVSAGAAYLVCSFDDLWLDGGFTTTPLVKAGIAWQESVGSTRFIGYLLGSVFAALAFGSIAGFRPRWILEGRTLRRVVSVSTVAGLPLLLASAVAGYSISEFATIEPYSPFTQIVDIVPSPAGERAAIFVQWGYEDSWSDDRLGSVFVIGVEDSALVPLPVFGVWPEHIWREEWREDDTVSVWSQITTSHERVPYRLDLNSGDLLFEASAKLQAAPAIHARTIDRGRTNGRGSKHEYSYEGLRTVFQSDGWPTRQRDSLMAFSRSMEGELVAHDLATGEARVLASEELLGSFHLSRDQVSGGGGYIGVRGETGGRIIRVADGTDVTPIADLSYVHWDRRCKNDRFAILFAQNNTVLQGSLLELSSPVVLWDLETGETIALGKSRRISFAVTSKNEVLLAHGSRLLHWAPGMEEPRVLYEPRALTAEEQELVSWQ